MFRNFRGKGLARNMFFNSSRQVPTGLANVTTWALFTLKLVDNIGGEARLHTVFVGEDVNSFESLENHTKAVGNWKNFVD